MPPLGKVPLASNSASYRGSCRPQRNRSAKKDGKCLKVDETTQDRIAAINERTIVVIKRKAVGVEDHN